LTRIVLGKVVDPDIPYFGAEVRYAILKDQALIPGLHIRGSYSQTFNVDQLDLRTYALDLSVSKGFGAGIKITPYAGVGAAWVSSKASHLAPGLSLGKEEFLRAMDSRGEAKQGSASPQSGLQDHPMPASGVCFLIKNLTTGVLARRPQKLSPHPSPSRRLGWGMLLTNGIKDFAKQYCRA
jgi:hypothetical protein